MSDRLDRAVDARINAYRPDIVPPFAAVEARKRGRDRRRLLVVGGVMPAVALAATIAVVPQSRGGGDERLTPGVTDQQGGARGDGNDGLSLEEYEGGHVLYEREGVAEVERVDFPVFLRNDTSMSVTIRSTSVPETDLVGYVQDAVLAPGGRLPLGFSRTVECSGPVLPADPHILVTVRFDSGEERSISLPLTDTVTLMYRSANACAD